MTALWVTIAVPAVATISAAVYANGGRSALERRTMRQELEIAAALPPDAQRTALEQAVEDRAARYLAHQLGREPLNGRQHWALFAISSIALAVGSGCAILSRVFSGSTKINAILEDLSGVLMVAGLAISAIAATTWLCMFVMGERTRSRRLATAAHRERINHHIGRTSR